ncbi:host cell division inhibitor Icd-like protein [Haemophilus quentini]|uniref:host cell division inhibitor Icd-like protein n=1 Tax=Haemophilus quentini TaxID=123834 RepID=UPI0009F73198|nr:host cell division inhibitor Icd-like protein [Haemophilus quentini]
MSDTQTKHFNKRAYYSAFSRLSPSIYAPLRKYLHGNAKNNLLSAVKFGIISLQSKKTIAEPRNSIYLLVAQSTPKACFFMRNIRTPKEFADFVLSIQNPIFLSMVACSGKGSPFAVVHKSQFSRPLHVTAKASKLSAVTLKKLSCGVTQMYQFIFALIRAPQIKIRLLADNEQQARSRFTDGDTLLFVGRINQNPFKNNRTSLTDGNNHSLPAGQNVGSIESTTTIEGNRNPYQCGIFLPKIHSLHAPKKLGALSYIEFAVQMISRNKAEFIRTNKASRSIAVVESVSHPFTGDTLTLTKSIGNPTMKIYPKNNRTLAALPTLSVSAAQGGVYA